MSRRPRASAALPVTFRYRPPRASHVVDLRGELPHFYEYTPMKALGGGLYEATVALEPGVYGYKFFLAGDEWLLDPENPRTRGRDGKQNSIVIVGGTDEPVLHAPARPWVFVDDDGLLVVRAGLRRGAGDRLGLSWDEGDGPRTSTMVPCAEEDEHRMFEARIPASARTVRYRFDLESGRAVGLPGGAGQWLSVERSAVRPRAPAWWRDAVVYTVFVDRFRRRGGTWDAAGGERDRAGGDLEGVIEALDHIADLGVTAIHLTPIHLSPSAHRYEAVDPRVVDPELGGAEAFARLLDRAHAKGLRVICDMPVTHVHRDFFAFHDVRERGFASPYVHWFYVDAHPFGEGPEPGYRHYQKGQWKEPLLRVESPEVAAYLGETFAHWARLGVDGFRVDAAADVPFETLDRIAAAARAAREDVALFGEVVPENFQLYTRSTLDAATDFSHREQLLEWLVRRNADARGYASVRARRRFDRGGPGHTAVAFTATHDQSRFFSEAPEGDAALVAELMTVFGAAVPALYYGDEVGLTGGGGPRAFEDAWPDRARMPWPEPGQAASSHWDSRKLELIRRALHLRREHAVLRRGDEQVLVPEVADGGSDQRLLVIRRSAGDDVVDVCVNGSGEDRRIRLAGGAPAGATLLFSSNDAGLDGGVLRLGPWCVAALRRAITEEDEALWADVRARNGDLARAAFRAGQYETAPLPTRLYLTVTERCNLRCEHCITFAPDKTARGTARSVEPWLLEALREPFAAAEYIAFVHGGESLVSPMFPEVLRAIRRAKGPGTPAAQIHLLSNGMLLTPDRAVEVAELGVTSLSVSLDGATAVTNDSLRAGGKLAAIVRNLELLTRARDARGFDLRVGISTVVTAGNASELPALGHLARELGVDWIKVEELFPCTPRARQEMIEPRDSRVASAVAQLRDALEGTSIVVVEHLDPPRGCGCDALNDERTRQFRQADDFANRTVFQPCRMEWEQACIDPDGTVHAVTYDAPALGTLAEASMLDLWNGEPAQRQRERALRRTRASARRACRC